MITESISQIVSRVFAAGLLAVVFLGAAVAEASSVVRTGQTVSVADDQVIDGDFYTAAGKINVSGEVKEDMISAGGQVTLNGTVGGDVFILGGQADVHGTVSDDLRIIAGEATVAEPVMGDVFVIGGVVNILSTASVAGDVVIFGGEAIIEGSVGGNVLGTTDRLRIDAPVTGDVDITVTQLILGDKAQVEGTITYVSNELAIRAPNAIVGGELLRNDPILPLAESSAKSAIIPMLILLFSALVWYWVSRRSLQNVVTRINVKTLRSFVYGFLTILIAPFAITILFVSMIGSVVGVAAFFGYVLLLTLSLIGLSAVVGQLLMRAFNQQAAKVTLTTLVIGVIGVTLLLMLPLIGHLILIGFTVITLGSMVDLLIHPEVK